MPTVFWLRVGAIWGFLAVAMGAFGAHVLRDRFIALGQVSGDLTSERLQATFQTASQYHMYCALAILGVGILSALGRPSSLLHASGWAFLLGSVVFSGSLYVLSVTGIGRLGAITPIGGLGILAGWLLLAFAAKDVIPR
jgi:uncharacterized membrane protein YgdD (TMEM256/DUF423 family)